MIRMKADVNNVIAGQNKVTANQRLLNAAMGKTNTAGLHAAKGISVATKQNQLLARSMQHVSHMAVGTFGLFQLQQAGAEAVKTLATYQDMRTRLQAMSSSSADYAEKEAYLITLAKDHHKELNSLANGYAGLSVMVKDNIINDEQARKMLEGLSNAASHTGADAENLKQVLYGLNQALGQGVVQSQELNQVVEPMPGLLSKIAKVAGYETGAQFKKMVGDGKITSKMFSELLVKALAEYEGAAARTADNINAKFADLNTNYTLMVKAFEAPINNALSQYFTASNSTMELFTDNAEAIVDVLEVGISLALVRAGAAGVNYTLSLASTAKAAAASKVQTVTLAQAEVARAQAAYNSAKAGGVAGVAEQRLMVARANLTAVTRTTTIAQKGLNTALSFLGGPVGLAMLATYAIYEFSTSADDASSKTKLLAGDVDALKENYKSLSELQLRAKIVEVTNAIKAQAEIVKAQSQSVKALQATTRQVWDNNLHEMVVENITLTKAEKDQLILTLAAEETANKNLNKQLALHLDLQNQLRFLSGGGKPDSKSNTGVGNVAGNKELAKLEASLQSKEQRIKSSYVKRQLIVDNALQAKQVTQAKYNSLSMALEAQQELQLNELKAKNAADVTQRANEARQLKEQRKRDGWNLELAQLQGYHSLVEAEEAAHNERMMAVKTRKTGELQGTLLQFANWQKKTELEKTSAVVALGEQGFKAMAGQSKKAFALYKAFSIGQALIKTYESATAAYAALAPIPIIGPALGIAAAGVAVTMGIANVNAIKSQQPQGFYNGGSIGRNQNVIEFGERNEPEVLEFEGKNYLLGGNGGAVFNRSQLQNVPSGTAVSGSSGAPIIYLKNYITIEGDNNDGSNIEAGIELSTQKMRAELLEDFSTGGELTQQLKRAM